MNPCFSATGAASPNDTGNTNTRSPFANRVIQCYALPTLSIIPYLGNLFGYKRSARFHREGEESRFFSRFLIMRATPTTQIKMLSSHCDVMFDVRTQLQLRLLPSCVTLHAP